MAKLSKLNLKSWKMMSKCLLSDVLNKIHFQNYIKMFGSVWTGVKTIPFDLWPLQEQMVVYIIGNKIVLLPKSRQLGASEIAAERSVYDSFRIPNCQGVIISKSEEFAKYFLDHRIMPKVKYLHENIKYVTWPEVVNKTQDRVDFSNGSWIKSLTSSQTSAASMSLNYIIFDEAGGIDENHGNFRQLYANARPALEERDNSWALIIGTSVPGSHFNNMVYRSVYDPEYNIKHFFLPWNTNPKRTDKWYLEQAKELGDDVYLQYPRTIDDFFHVKEGLVFKSFDPKEGGKHIREISIEETRNCLMYVIYDHGFLHPAVCHIAFYDPYEDHLFIFEEIFYKSGHQTEVTVIANNIKNRINSFNRIPTRMIADNDIVKSRGVKSVADIFKTFGLNFHSADKYDEKGSRQLLSDRFTHKTITINSCCVNTIDQLRNYRWNTNKSGEHAEDKNDDTIDTLRYACAEVKKRKRETVNNQKQYYVDRFSRDSNYEPTMSMAGWQSV